MRNNRNAFDFDFLEIATEGLDVFDPTDVNELLKASINYAFSDKKEIKATLFNDIDMIVKRMKVWLVEFNKQKIQFEKTSNLNRQTVADAFGMKSVYDVNKDIYQEYNRQFGMKNQINYENEANKLKNLYVEGYKLWEAFRALATHQSIDFGIMYGKSKEYLYEAKVSPTEFFERAELKLQSHRNKNDSFSYDIKILDFKVAKDKTQREEERRSASSFFYRQMIERYHEGKRALGKNFTMSKKGMNLSNVDKYELFQYNQGAVYETYEEIRLFDQFPVDKGVSNKWFETMDPKWLIEELNKNSLDWSSGRRVGDQGLRQLKNISEGSNAQLSAIQTLPEDIQKLITVWEGQQSDELVNSLIGLLTEDATKNNVSLSYTTQKLNELAQDYIRKAFGGKHRVKH